MCVRFSNLISHNCPLLYKAFAINYFFSVVQKEATIKESRSVLDWIFGLTYLTTTLWKVLNHCTATTTPSPSPFPFLLNTNKQMKRFAVVMCQIR